MNRQQLHQEQSALLHALMAWPRQSDSVVAQNLPIVQHSLAARGLNAYRANAHAGAQSALQAAYPVLVQLLGEESFQMLACAFWHHQPPTCGDWAQWGGGLATYVGEQETLQGVAYLSDVARLEWQLHQLASAPDAAVDASSLQALLSEEPDHLRLKLAAHLPVWSSAYPVVSIVLAHQTHQAHQEPQTDLSEAAHLLREGVSQEVLVWRQGFKPCVRQALPGEAAFLASVQAGCSLGEALSASPDLNFEQWLATAVQSRLFLAVQSLSIT